ncbi:hypothetical protein Tco_0903500 [Tanacetum coccineum]
MRGPESPPELRRSLVCRRTYQSLSEHPKDKSGIDASTKLTRAKLNKRSVDADLSKDKSGPELPLEFRRSWYVEGHIKSRVISSVLMQRYLRGRLISLGRDTTPFQNDVLSLYGLEVGWIRRIHVLDTAYWGFLRVGTTFDIFQNIILIPYLEYGILSPLDTAYWGFLRVGTTFDIFQNIILIPYLEYGILSPLDTAY